MKIANRLPSLLALTLVAGCAVGNDAVDSENADDQGELQQSATGSFRISCPRSTSATWIQALNGTVDLLVGQTSVPGFQIAGPTTTLQCFYGSSAVPQILDHTVQFPPGTVPSACGAKATFSGQGQQIGGGVPPFGGW